MVRISVKDSLSLLSAAAAAARGEAIEQRQDDLPSAMLPLSGLLPEGADSC